MQPSMKKGVVRMAVSWECAGPADSHRLLERFIMSWVTEGFNPGPPFV
jgi:hypothetical protein